MIGKPRPGRYRLHELDSPEGGAVLAEQGLTRADLERALAELERTEGTRIRSIVGINDDGVFGQSRLAPGLLAFDQGRARAAERIEHDVPALA